MMTTLTSLEQNIRSFHVEAVFGTVVEPVCSLSLILMEIAVTLVGSAQCWLFSNTLYILQILRVFKLQQGLAMELKQQRTFVLVTLGIQQLILYKIMDFQITQK